MINLITGVLLTVAGWLLIRKLIQWRWPYQCVIAERRGNAIRWVLDERAARFKNKKNPAVQYFKLRKAKHRIPPTEYKYINIDKKGKNVLPLYNPEEGQYFPCTIENKKIELEGECPQCNTKIEATTLFPLNFANPPELKVQEKDISFFVSVEKDRVDKQYATDSWIQKYGALVGILAVCGVLAFIVIWQGGITLQVGNQLLQMTSIAAETARAMAQISPPIPTPTPPLGG